MGRGFLKTYSKAYQGLDSRTNMQAMVANAFQWQDELVTLEDKATQIIEKAFQIADGLGDPRRNEVNLNGGDGV